MSEVQPPRTQYAVCSELLAPSYKAAIDAVSRLQDALGCGVRLELAPHTLGVFVKEIDFNRRRWMYGYAAHANVEVDALHWLLAGGEQIYGPLGLNPHITSPNAGRRADSVHSLIELARFLYDIRGESPGGVMVFGSPKQRDVQGIPYEQAESHAANVFSDVLDVIDREGLGTTIAMEMLGEDETKFCCTPDQVRALRERVGRPNFQYMVDVKAMARSGIDPAEAIRETPIEYLARVHGNDSTLYLPGDSESGRPFAMDFKPVVRALQAKFEAGLDTDKCRLSLEPFKLRYPDDPVQEFSESLFYLLRMEEHVLGIPNPRLKDTEME